MARLSAWYGRLLDALVVAACVLLLMMTVMIGADVVSRNLGGGGVPVSNEITEDILYLMTLLAAPWLLRQGRHIRVDIILRTLPVRMAWLLEWFGDIVCRICCLYFVWYGLLITT
jgi:TRAP-type C4-dicarboxylate transport system permease small subunit